jgi:hypothetical protein
MEKLEILTVFLFFRLFTMEYCIASMDHIFLPPGDKQKYNGPLPNRGEVLIQLASGLEYIHSSGFSHGNIKPRSVLIANTNNKITMKWGNLKIWQTLTLGYDGKFENVQTYERVYARVYERAYLSEDESEDEWEDESEDESEHETEHETEHESEHKLENLREKFKKFKPNILGLNFSKSSGRFQTEFQTFLSSLKQMERDEYLRLRRNNPSKILRGYVNGKVHYKQPYVLFKNS